ncbi:MAG: GntR family transcriptional regulator, partial [Tabrizicola sp.]
MRVESSLPGDGELMARFGVSRAGLREAIRTLAAMGLVEAAPRSAPGSCRNRAGTSSIVRPRPGSWIATPRLPSWPTSAAGASGSPQGRANREAAPVGSFQLAEPARRDDAPGRAPCPGSGTPRTAKPSSPRSKGRPGTMPPDREPADPAPGPGLSVPLVPACRGVLAREEFRHKADHDADQREADGIVVAGVARRVVQEHEAARLVDGVEQRIPVEPVPARGRQVVGQHHLARGKHVRPLIERLDERYGIGLPGHGRQEDHADPDPA